MSWQNNTCNTDDDTGTQGMRESAYTMDFKIGGDRYCTLSLISLLTSRPFNQSRISVTANYLYLIFLESPGLRRTAYVP